MSDPEVFREGERFWTEVPGLELRITISDYDPISHLHYVEVDGQSGTVHVDQAALASSRQRASVLRNFAPVQRDVVDRQLMRLYRRFREDRDSIADELEPVILNAEDVEIEDMRWLWPARIPRRKLVMFDGDPGLGKSMAALDLGARISIGLGMPDGATNAFGGACVGTLVLSAEDDPADTYVPRWLAAGGNPKLLRFLPGVKTHRGDRSVNLGDLAAIRRAMESTQARLLIVDPLMAYVPPTSDSWRDESMRRLLKPVQELVASLDAALLCIRHLTKDTKRPAIYRGQASMGISGAARATFVFGKHPSDPTGEQRVMATVKFNIGLEPRAIGYQVVMAQGERWPHVRWGKPMAMTADELLAGPESERQPGDDLLDACDVLRSILADGPALAAATYQQGSAAGVSRRTLERAKAHLGVRSIKDGEGGAWRWHLPTEKSTSPTDDDLDLGDVGDLSRNGRGDVGDVGGLQATSPRSPTAGASSVGDVGDEPLSW